MKNSLMITFFKLWAKTGLALGWLYKNVDQYSKHFSGEVLPTRLFDGSQMECDLRDHIQRQIYFFGAYEPIESFLLKESIEPDDVVIDAGANIGFYSLVMASSVKTGKVYSFEPVPQTFEKLKHNISCSPNEKRIQLNNFGLWNQTTTLNFSLADEMEDNIGSFTAGRVERAISQHECKVIKLDDYAKEFSRLDFIKMDIEGAELAALEGGQKTIEKFRPQFLIEINRKACQRFQYDPQALCDFFKKMNYEFYLVGDVDHRSGWIHDFSKIEQANVFVMNEKRKLKIPNRWDAKRMKRSFINLQR